MVVALREQTPKKSKLSLFRLVKSSSKTNISANLPEASAQTYDSSYSAGSDLFSYPSSDSYADSIPRQVRRHDPTPTGRVGRSVRQAASEGAPQSSEASEFGDNYNEVRMRETTAQDNEQHMSRSRSDSLPLEGFIHPFEAQRGRSHIPALARIQTEMAPTSKHYRTRSHFSIPDVIVTTCESEGEEELVEVQIPPNKRRSYVLRENSEDSLREHRSNKKSSIAWSSKAAPLIQFNADEMRSMVRSGSVPSLSNSPISPTSSASPSTPSSSASSSLSKGSVAKKGRKSSFPLLFGRKSSDSDRSAQQTFVEEPLPATPTTPNSAPAILSESNGAFTRSMSGLPSPPITPTSPSSARPLSKKELKAKAKEELALIKELERVNKLVKQHDVKARKAQEKADAKERKRAAKLEQVTKGFQMQGGETRPSVESYASSQARTLPARKTVFQAATKGSASGGLVRRTSVRGAPERRGSEPTIATAPSPLVARGNVSGPFSVDLPASERHQFSAPRPAPHPLQPKANNPRLPPATQRTQPQVLTDIIEAETSLTTDDPDDSAQDWSRQSLFWSNLDSELNRPLPSLIQPSTSVSSDEDLASQRSAKAARRASVQRVLALSNTNNDKKRGSQHFTLKRRSSQFLEETDMVAFTAVGGCSSKRSSVASDARRRSLIRQIGENEGWSVIGTGGDESEAAGVDDSTVAVADLSCARWEDWVEDKEEKEEEEKMDVDVILADLRAAQQAHRLHKQSGGGAASPSRPTRSTRRDAVVHSSSISSMSADSVLSRSSATGTAFTEVAADMENAEPFAQAQEKGSKDTKFRLSLALAPLQPLELFT